MVHDLTGTCGPPGCGHPGISGAPWGMDQAEAPVLELGTQRTGVLTALWHSTHPGPCVVVTTLTFALGVAVGLEPWRLVLLAAAVLAGQFSIGLSNDVIDADRDRASGRTDKPIAQGVVSKRVAWHAALACLAVAVLLSVPLGLAMVLAHLATIGAAWLYNAALKRSVFSLLPFLSFGLLPSLATLSAPDPQVAAPWATAAGCAFGVAVHLTNVLPDLEADQRTAVRGTPHLLGARASAVLAALAVVGGAIAVLLGPAAGSIAAINWLAWVFFGLVSACAVAALLLVLLRPPSRTPFRLMMMAALLLGVQLVATGGSLVG